MLLQNKKFFSYLVWSNLYLPILIIYFIYDVNYLDFTQLSKSFIYIYLLISTQLLNTLHFKLALGTNTNKKLIQSILSKCNIKISDILSSLITVIISIFIFSLIAILFGANLLSNHEQTLVFALFVSILTVFPACIHFNSTFAVNLLTSGQLINSSNYNINEQKFILHKSYCTLLGTWLGAFVIPLDWNRDWQIWPIPCCLGTLIGSSMGQLLSLFYVSDILQYKTTSFLFSKNNVKRKT